MILDESCFKYLYSIYGGTDIRRISIELAQDFDERDPQDVTMKTSEGEETSPTPRNEEPRKEYIVETHLRKIKVQIIPQMSFYPTCKSNPFIVYVSRNCSVGDL